MTYRFIRSIVLISLIVLCSLSIAQEKNRFSRAAKESDLIVRAKVNNTQSRWISDEKGKHIYTIANLEIYDFIKGSHNQNQFELKIIGGTIDGITETVSDYFTIKKDDELILFLRSNPMRVLYGNDGVFNVKDGNINFGKSSLSVDAFSGVISDLLESKIDIENNSNLGKEIILKSIKYDARAIDNQEIIKLNKNLGIIPGEILTGPNLLPYKPSDWGDKIIIKKSSISPPVGTQLAADDSPIYDSDNLYAAFALLNSGDATAVSFNSKIFIDNVEYASLSYSNLGSGYYVYWYNVYLGALSLGDHTIKIVTDSQNQVSESNETDNEYTRNITIQHLSGTPLINSITPISVSAGTGSNITINGSGFGNVRGTSVVEFFYNSSEPKTQVTNVVSWSDNQIVCKVPSQVSSGPVTIVTSSGTSNGINIDIPFSYLGRKWDGSFPVIPYKINENYGLISGEGNALQAALNSWSSSGANFGFSYSGSSSATSASYNSENSILFGSTDGSIATNYSWSINSVLVETDIVFNSSAYAFSTDGSADTFDIQSIALHELGHSLALGDLYGIGDDKRTMYGFGSVGDISRNLSSDDIDGIKYIYGSGAAPPAFSISGTIFFNGNPLSGVLVSMSGSSNQNYTTSTDGNYTFNGLSSGDYTIIASKLGYSFSPSSKSFTNISTSQTQNFTASLNQFTITSNAGTNGTISPSGVVTVDYGGSQSFAITPNNGYHIADVLVDGVSVGALSSYSFNNVIANHTLSVSFAINSYTLTITSNNGTVAKSPDQENYNHGTSVTLTATPTLGYTFTGWSSDASGSTNPLTITMDANKNITANYEINTYTLAITSDNGTVTKNPDQENYNHGTSVTLTATPSLGYTFTGWSSDASGSTNPLTITMDANKNITANYEINTYTLAITSDNGTVTKNPDQENYNHGTSVTLTATPSVGYTFTGWSSDASGSTNPLTIIMDANKNVTAEFAINTYTLAITSDNGTVTKNPDQVNYSYGTSVTLTATPQVGYKFTGWSGNASGSTNPLTITMDANKNITASFEINTYTLAINSTNGTVAKDPNQPNYNYGTSVTLTATPSVGYRFTGWSGDASGSTNPLTVTMDANKNITASFAINTYTLAITSSNGTVTRNPDQANYDYGTSVTLTATPSVGYTFTGWSGDASGSINPLTVTMDANKNVTANYALYYSINTSSFPTYGGSTTGSGIFQYGQQVKVTAIPSQEFTFIHWFEGNNIFSTNLEYNFSAESNRNLTARFDRPPSFTVVIPNNTVVNVHNVPVKFSFQYNGTDPDNDPMFFSLISKPAGSEITADGLFSWYPTVDQVNQQFQVTVQLSDGFLTATNSTLLVTSNSITGIDDYSDVPQTFSLSQNYPNPFNPSTKIKFGLPKDAFTKLIIYNLLGQEVETLLSTELKAGYHEVEFNASKLTSGIYFYRIITKEFNTVKKLILMK